MAVTPYNHDIFLDVFNPEMRQRMGYYRSLSAGHHLRLLTYFLRLAVLFAQDRVILPPGFMMECQIARQCIQKNRGLIEVDLIKAPLKEDSYWELKEKKEAEYRDFTVSNLSSPYIGIYSDHADRLLGANPRLFIRRKSAIGIELNKRWQERISEYLGRARLTLRLDGRRMSADTVEQITGYLLQSGSAITIEAIDRYWSLEPEARRKLHDFVLDCYRDIYAEEFGLAVISGYPNSLEPYLGSNVSGYEYSFLDGALLLISLKDTISRIPSLALFELRVSNGWRKVLSQCSNLSATFLSPSLRLREFRKSIRTGLLEKLSVSSEKIASQDGRDQTAVLDCVREYAHLLDCSLPDVLQSSSKTLTSQLGVAPRYASWKKIMSECKKLMVFVALEEELTVLQYRWGLVAKEDMSGWTGFLGGTRVDVISPLAMGRVPAAIATYGYLSHATSIGEVPDAIILVGIAGGFQENGVNKGDVLLANEIVDLASRKIRGHSPSDTVFVPRVFRTKGAIAAITKRSEFDQGRWALAASKSSGWPFGLGSYPVLRAGPIGSLDEVVKSDEWRARMLETHPKMLGVEMEAGGVAAAAEVFGIDIDVVRGVSDHADPSKKDDVWRSVSINVVANLLESIFRT